MLVSLKEVSSMYTVAKAASLIGCTRTTIYKYIKKDPDRYLVSRDGQRMISEQGLELLKADVRDTLSRVSASADKVGDDTLKSRLQQATERIHLLESANTRLTAKIESLTIQHDADQVMILMLQQARADTQKALENEQSLHLQTMIQAKGNWLTRLLGKTPKHDQIPADADVK